jgi:sensor c-di-GMP phosphodiesterase-like protein
MAACGMIAGYFLGCALAVRLAENSLERYIKVIALREDAESKEAHSVLDVMSNSPYPFCSDAEVTYFRDLVFRSEYLKDAGRLRDGRIECSATAGHTPRSILRFTPGIPQHDGTIAYGNLAPARDDNLKRPALQLGSSYVVFGSYLPTEVGPIPMQVSSRVTSADDPGTSGSTQQAARGNGTELTTKGAVRRGDTLYATWCSALRPNCVTVSTSVSEALWGESSKIAGVAGLTGCASALLGLTFAIMYSRSRNLEQQLRRAIAYNKLSVVYQPIVSLASGQIVGAEALARWSNEEGHTVGPDVFIKIAEERGFVGALTKLIVRRALQDFGDTLRTRSGFRLSVNVTAADLADSGFLPMLDGVVDRAKVPPESLAIEITESSTANREVAMETVRLLRRRGYSVHIDDFGTGYSSLSYLLYLSVDTIKIDKAFTQAIGTESVTVAILPQIMAMAKSLNLDVVVEGVETHQQADYFSTSTQRIYGQGWLYGHPVSAEEFHHLLADDRRRKATQDDFACDQAALSCHMFARPSHNSI